MTNGDRATYDNFRRSAELYAAGINSDRGKILATLSFLTEGDAAQWCRNFTEKRMTDVQANKVSWAAFLAALDKQFRNPREAENARKQLFSLKMGEQVATTFFLKVDELRTKGELTDPAYHDRLIVEHLQRHMNPPWFYPSPTHTKPRRNRRSKLSRSSKTSYNLARKSSARKRQRSTFRSRIKTSET